MDGFDDFILYLTDMANRVKSVAKAVDESQGEKDPVKMVEKRLGIKANGLIPQVPLMDEDTARKASADPEFLEHLMGGERLRDALGGYIAGDK